MKFCKILFVLFFYVLFSGIVFASDIELSADNGLEWDQNNMTISAVKNASITRDKLNLTSDKITVKYRNRNKKLSKNSTEIFMIIAEGNVFVISPKEQINSDYMEYNLDTGIILIKSYGKPIKMKAHDVNILAHGNIIYYEQKNYAIVNKAEVIHSGRSLLSDVMKLEFDKISTNIKNKSNIGLGLSKITATGNLTIKDKLEVLTGDVAIYDNKTGLVSIDGNVRLSRGGGSKLQGGKIEYNMKTGITKLLPDPAFGKVIGIFQSSNKKIIKNE